MKVVKSMTMTKVARLAPYTLHTDTEWISEPDLLFAGGHTHPDPKVGIPLYGPRSLGTGRHKQEIHVGFIGTAEAVDHARSFYATCASGVDGDADHAPFPGYQADRGFRSDLRMDDRLVELITRQESQALLDVRSSRDRFEATTSLIDHKLQILTRRDHPLDYVVLALTPDLYSRCRTADYVEKGLGKVHRDLRRTVKALAMKHRKPVQILQETTTGLVQSRRKLDHASRIAWNLFTGLYFKAEGLPWGPTGLPPASCIIGISFFRPLGEHPSTLRTSVVQAFDENGDGLVLRGHSFAWDQTRQGKSPHLTDELAGNLIELVLDKYEEERRQPPQRVVVHKTSRFEPAERAGFEAALSRRVRQYDLVALQPVSDVRLIRSGQYPPLRGTAFTAGDTSYLYTSGYLPLQGGYPHGHVPSPLQFADHVGDTPRVQLMREIMVLTKMNWNSANMSGLLPITLRFSRLVGDILRELPPDQEPEPKYKYYM
jgi:hypothetical protein